MKNWWFHIRFITTELFLSEESERKYREMLINSTPSSFRRIVPSRRQPRVILHNGRKAQNDERKCVWRGISPRTIHYRYRRSSISGPITNSHSWIKSRIVIQHSSCIIIRYIGEYSSSMYRIILPALLSCCANPPRDRDPVFRFILSFYLPSFPSLLFAFHHSFARISKSTWTR